MVFKDTMGLDDITQGSVYIKRGQALGDTLTFRVQTEEPAKESSKDIPLSYDLLNQEITVNHENKVYKKKEAVVNFVEFRLKDQVR